jgi:hypothetical protein
MAGESFSNPYNENYYVSNLETPENMIFITGGSGTTPLWGFIDGATSFGASAQWESGMIGADAQNKVSGIAAGLSNLIGSSQQMKSARTTMQTWQNSTTESIAFNIIKLADMNKPGEDPMDFVRAAWSYVLPGKARDSGTWLGKKITAAGGGDLMVSPGGYAVDITGGQTGQISLAIGEWFYSPNSWIATSLKVEVSKQRKKGTKIPLWTKIDLVLSPSREFFADEVAGWFLK